MATVKAPVVDDQEDEFEHYVHKLNDLGFAVVDKQQFLNMALFCGLHNMHGFEACKDSSVTH